MQAECRGNSIRGGFADKEAYEKRSEQKNFFFSLAWFRSRSTSHQAEKKTLSLSLSFIHSFSPGLLVTHEARMEHIATWAIVRGKK